MKYRPSSFLASYFKEQEVRVGVYMPKRIKARNFSRESLCEYYNIHIYVHIYMVYMSAYLSLKRK